jgi:hypothetical protein
MRAPWLIVLVGCSGGSHLAPQPMFSLSAPVHSTAQIAADRLVVADFNGDGKLDAVITNAAIAKIAVLLGNGDGTFSTNIGAGPVAPVNGMAAGDFDGDGKMDIAAAELEPMGAYLGIFGGNGDGTFGGASMQFVGATAGSLVAGDFNGDGTLDAAVLDDVDDQIVAVLSGQQTPARTPLSMPAQALAAADFDGDGKGDLAVAGGMANAPTLTLMRGNGDGTFKAGASYDFTGYTAGGIAAGDLNGDGKQDVVMAAPNDTLAVFAGKGDGTLANPSMLPLAHGGAAKILIADLDGGGRADLVLVALAGATLSVALGRGDGTFLADAPVGSSDASGDVAIGDANGDGRPDLVAIAGNMMSALLNTSQ